MDLCYKLCSSRQPAGQPSCLAKFQHWILHTNCSTKCFFILAMLLGTVYTIFTNLDLAWESQDQHKAKPAVFIFFCTFHLIIIFDVVMEQFKLNILRLLLSKIDDKKGNTRCYTDCINKPLMLACIWTFMNRFVSNLV